MKAAMLVLLVLTVVGGVLMMGCQSAPEREPLRAIDRPIELSRFMGPWHVIAHIPAFIEDEAYNGVESYHLDDDGTIATTYTFNNGGFDGPLRAYHPRGFVYNLQTKAEWRMRAEHGVRPLPERERS